MSETEKIFWFLTGLRERAFTAGTYKYDGHEELTVKTAFGRGLAYKWRCASGEVWEVTDRGDAFLGANARVAAQTQ